MNIAKKNENTCRMHFELAGMFDKRALTSDITAFIHSCKKSYYNIEDTAPSKNALFVIGVPPQPFTIVL